MRINMLKKYRKKNAHKKDSYYTPILHIDAFFFKNKSQLIHFIHNCGYNTT